MATTLDGEPTNTTRREVRARLGCGIVRTVDKYAQMLEQPGPRRERYLRHRLSTARVVNGPEKWVIKRWDYET